tara:strand:+ start:1369 stop:1563 length:195 start_codon:yes stop_codon:yes gene_type:complete
VRRREPGKGELKKCVSYFLFISTSAKKLFVEVSGVLSYTTGTSIYPSIDINTGCLSKNEKVLKE